MGDAKKTAARRNRVESRGGDCPFTLWLAEFKETFGESFQCSESGNRRLQLAFKTVSTLAAANFATQEAFSRNSHCVFIFGYRRACVERRLSIVQLPKASYFPKHYCDTN